MLKRKVIFVLLAVAFLVGCATVNVQLTKQDLADWMLSIYNSQYADYKTWFVTDPATGDFKLDAQGNAILKPGTPPAQVALLQKKKAIFKEVWPLILTYAEYAKTGTVPAGTVIGEVEARAVTLINDLIRAGR
jgi:hypothetical protein